MASTNLTIRSYDAARDLAACRGLWRELTERHRLIYDDPTIGGDDPGPYFDEVYLREPAWVASWVAVAGDQVVGLTGLFVEGDGATVEPVVVSASWRGQGIGAQLLDTARAAAIARGCSSLSIKPVARNVEAIRMFHRAGFQTLGHVDLFMELSERAYRWNDGQQLHDLPMQW